MQCLQAQAAALTHFLHAARPTGGAWTWQLPALCSRTVLPIGHAVANASSYGGWAQRTAAAKALAKAAGVQCPALQHHRHLHSSAANRCHNALQPCQAQVSCAHLLPHDRHASNRRLSSQPRPRPPADKPARNTNTDQESFFTLANSISLARLCSAPLLGWWLLTEQWHLCLPGLILAGLSDWADGAVAKHFGQDSVLGSYLDPLADKAVLASVIGALGWSGALSLPVVGVLIGRDVLLVVGGFAHRLQAVGWDWRSKDFFRTTPGGAAPAAPHMKPILVSKANTVLQFAVVGSCMCRQMCGWPSDKVSDVLVLSTVGTTVASGIQYWRLYAAGKLV